MANEFIFDTNWKQKHLLKKEMCIVRKRRVEESPNRKENGLSFKINTKSDAKTSTPYV